MVCGSKREKIVLDICLSCRHGSYECYIGVGHRSYECQSKEKTII